MVVLTHRALRRHLQMLARSAGTFLLPFSEPLRRRPHRCPRGATSLLLALAAPTQWWHEGTNLLAAAELRLAGCLPARGRP